MFRAAKLTVTFAAIALAATALAGCTATGGPTASGQTAKPAAAAEAGPGGGECTDMTSSDGGDFLTDGVLHADALEGMRDTGVRPGASGTVSLSQDGGLAAYTVAEGDRPEAIAARMCAATAWLDALNAVRRESWLAGSPHSMRLNAGDTLNLDPATITTVGDEDGHVQKNEPDFDLPPQR
ncbi:hypothetical protein [Microbacterium sp.]|uniref:hypothetical protein n=1 Tax=Microbacterium sp. TaxID=51671 RepID=UPI003A950ECB